MQQMYEYDRHWIHNEVSENCLTAKTAVTMQTSTDKGVGKPEAAKRRNECSNMVSIGRFSHRELGCIIAR